MYRVTRLCSVATGCLALAFGPIGIAPRVQAQSGVSRPLPQPAEFHNPILWEDLADTDILRVGDAYYYSASTMHYSPGAPILRSYDLVNWEYVGHSVPVLDFSPAYDLNGGSAYVRGVWASFLGFRKSNKTFYWGGCVDFKKTYIYTAARVEGLWSRKAVIDHCYYDAGLLVDDDDTMYVAYGNTKLHVARLSSDGTKEVESREVFATPPEIGVLEGSRFYKIGGSYYIFVTRPPSGEYVLKSTNGPFGPYTIRPFVLNAVAPVAEAGSPHQGGIVQTAAGDWYYMAFIDAFPGGRMPVLAPFVWTTDGWPELNLPKNRWGASYLYPATPHPTQSLTVVDLFTDKILGPEWEWNHNPDNGKWSLDGGLRLKTATVTNDLFMARNTLTHRILGPTSTATIMLDGSGMKDGDRAGVALFRNSSAWVGIKRDHGSLHVAMAHGLVLNRDKKAPTYGAEAASIPVSGGKVWLRVSADIQPGAARKGRFSYSLDGTNFHSIGPDYVLDNSWNFFMGYRYAIFNYATQSLGGEVTVSSFTMTSP